ncbi:hypothetical protein BDY19DRAFT_186714 [Irpex rosettiformis]|uniref:Uncharacterized protein n=1 Tax=Irpex rosettiformis TaxID=378272 RepID=A0ACB8U211_9APHY|nr:hypothetical protein BDY19DRAFT_186714 [Irpex rosettiformis]
MGAQLESDQGFVERTATATRELADWFDAKYARPSMSFTQQAWLTRPVLTTFLIILTALSAIPILLFLMLAIMVSITFIAIGLGIAIVSAAAVITFTGALLVCLLIFLVFVAIGLTGFTLATLFSYRYLASVRTNGIREGTTQWVQETRGQLSGTPVQPQSDGAIYKNGICSVKSPSSEIDDSTAIDQE